MEPKPIKLYFDYKSPFAYLAKDEAYRLEEDYQVQIEWLPYILDIPEALGDLQTRTTQQWRKIRYSYMDARRWANKRGLLVRGPDSSGVADLQAVYRDPGLPLARLIRGLHAKVNAIPFNTDPNLPSWMKRPTDEAIDLFVDTLVRNEVAVTVRRSKGREIAAACGQLRGKTAPRGRGSRQRELPDRRVDRSLRVQSTGVESDSIDRERR